MIITIRAGEQARESGLARCRRCHQTVGVAQGSPVPECPNCGNDQFEMRSGPGLPV